MSPPQLIQSERYGIAYRGRRLDSGLHARQPARESIAKWSEPTLFRHNQTAIGQYAHLPAAHAVGHPYQGGGIMGLGERRDRIPQLLPKRLSGDLEPPNYFPA